MARNSGGETHISAVKLTIDGREIVAQKDSTGGQLISFDRAKCVSCGECIQVCPVGALVEKNLPTAGGHVRFRHHDEFV